MVITSDDRGTSKMYPIKHVTTVSKEGFKSITEIQLIKSSKNTRNIEVDKTEIDDSPIHSFYAHS